MLLALLEFLRMLLAEIADIPQSWGVGAVVMATVLYTANFFVEKIVPLITRRQPKPGNKTGCMMRENWAHEMLTRMGEQVDALDKSHHGPSGTLPSGAHSWKTDPTAAAEALKSARNRHREIMDAHSKTNDNLARIAALLEARSL